MEFQNKYFITGCAGFIGSNLAESLINKGATVIGLDNFDDYYAREIKEKNLEQLLKSKNFSFIEGDIRDRDLLRKTMDNSIYAVVHLAGKAGVRPSIQNPMLYQSVNIEGTNCILEAMREIGLKKIAFASSSSVYGNNKKIPFQESDVVDFPISPYAATKKAGELICHTYHHLFGFDVACLRFFTVYGPRQRPEMAINLFTRQINNSEEIAMFGNGDSARDYTYIDDIVQGIEVVLQNLNGYKIYNLGESETTTLKSLIEKIALALDKTPIIKQMPQQQGDVDITFADISEAKKIGYNPQTPISSGIQKYVDWFLKNNTK